jgi:hypothetical protein
LNEHYYKDIYKPYNFYKFEGYFVEINGLTFSFDTEDEKYRLSNRRSYDPIELVCTTECMFK